MPSAETPDTISSLPDALPNVTNEASRTGVVIRLLDWLLKKRTVAVLLAMILLVGGVIAYQHLPLEAFPDVANMQVRIITQVPGKAPEEVERLVTIPIEKEVNGIPHSKPPRSISIFGLSVITIVFDDSVEPNTARQLVLERLSQADLPEFVHPELDPNASPVGEVYRYVVSGKNWSSMDRKELQDWYLNRRFRAVDGIIDSTGFGGPTRIFLVELDPGRLRALGVTQQDIAAALEKSNDSTGGSYLSSNSQKVLVRGLGLLKDVGDINNVVIRSNEDGTPIRVRDVANVSMAAAVRKGEVGLNKDDDVVEGILMMGRGHNPSEVIDNLNESWAEIAAGLPTGMELVPLYDRTALVHKTLDTVGHNVAEGVVLVVVFLMLFLFQVRSALICSVVIPSALLFAFVALTVFHIPANLLSLGAIDFGIIVDGAVIMVENINRRLSETCLDSGDQRGFAVTIADAAAEVLPSIVFATAIIVMTFLPVLTFEHVEGRLFKPLAIMMNLTLIGAMLATIIFVPVFCYLSFVRKPPSERLSPLSVWLNNTYSSFLNKSRTHSKKLVAVSLCLMLASLTLIPFLGAEFIPELEEGNIWLTVSILPASVTLDKSVEIAHKVREIIGGYPEVKNVLSQIGSPDDGTDPNPYNLIEVLVDLKPKEEWRKQFRTKEELVSTMDRDINSAIPGLICNFSQYIKDSMEEAMSGVKNGEFSIKFYGKDLDVLESLAAKTAHVMKGVPGICDVSHDFLLGQPQVVISINREEAARFAVRTQDILDIVETSIGGKAITKLVEGERQFDVIVRYQKNYREKPAELGEILVPTAGGVSIPLKQLATIEQKEGANSICRENNRRRMAVYANIRGRNLGAAVMDCQNAVAREVKLPAGYTMNYAGEFERAREAGARLAVVVPITIALIFAVLYMMFDSAAYAVVAISPVMIAVSVATVVSFLSGTPLSISSGVGLIALIGLSVQNAVVMMAKVREALSKGDLSVDDAITYGALTKVRPIVIAALVAAAGLVPAALSDGIGAQSQRPFAIVISCSIVPVTALCLMILPAIARILLRKTVSTITPAA